MPYYKCFIRGENFPGALIGEDGHLGFYTTRWLQALNPRRAELKAVHLLRRDPSFELPHGVTTPADARVYVEEITAVGRLPRFRGGGATWFKQDER